MSKDPLHTPAPWRVSDERECGTDHFATVMSHAEGMEGAVVAELSGGAPFRDGEGMANAHLIAAAPDLLAMLEKCFWHFGREIKRMSLKESADSGTQAMSQQVAKLLDSVSPKT